MERLGRGDAARARPRFVGQSNIRCGTAGTSAGKEADAPIGRDDDRERLTLRSVYSASTVWFADSA